MHIRCHVVEHTRLSDILHTLFAVYVGCENVHTIPCHHAVEHTRLSDTLHTLAAAAAAFAGV